MKKGNQILAWAEAQLPACRNIALRHFGTRCFERKPDRSPVTAADRAIEERLRRAIARAFPSDGIWGEEFGRTQPTADAYWTIDPIDGTRAFTRGFPSWGILLARVEREWPTVAVCDFPAVKTTIAVAPGVAAYERVKGAKRRLPRATAVKRLDEAVVFHGGSRWWWGTPYAAGFARLMRQCYLERAYGDCFAYLYVLRGQADAMLDNTVHLWDMAPFAAFARALGYAITDAQGRPSFAGPSGVIAHPSLNRQIVRYLNGS